MKLYLKRSYIRHPCPAFKTQDRPKSHVIMMCVPKKLPHNDVTPQHSYQASRTFARCKFQAFFRFSRLPKPHFKVKFGHPLRVKPVFDPQIGCQTAKCTRAVSSPQCSALKIAAGVRIWGISVKTVLTGGFPVFSRTKKHIFQAFHDWEIATQKQWYT